jgi:plasmid segregation protein ParM
MRISVDIGFGYTNAMNELGNKAVYPSVVGVKRTSSVAGVFGSEVNDDYVVTIGNPTKTDEDTYSYYVGDAALAAGGQRTWEEEHAKNRNLDVLISTAIGLLNEKDDEPVDLAVGLPMSVYAAQHADIKRKLTGLNLTVSVDGEASTGKKVITVGSVFVFPQGAGAYYAALHEINGDVKDIHMLNKPIAVIDVGFRTTDFLFMAMSKRGLIPREEPFTGSLDIGMNTAMKEIQQMAKKPLHGYEPDLKEVEKALTWKGLNGNLTAKGKNVDLKPFKKQAYEALESAISSQLKQRWGDDINTLAAILIAGGGGDDLFGGFEKSFDIAQKIEDPQFANARGYLAAQALALKGSAKGRG